MFLFPIMKKYKQLKYNDMHYELDSKFWDKLPSFLTSLFYLEFGYITKPLDRIVSISHEELNETL